MSENKEKYKKELAAEDLLVVETIAKRAMEFFGYRLQSSADWKPDARFVAQLISTRQSKSAELANEQAGAPDELEDKWRTISAMKADRKAQWESSNSYVSLDDEHDLSPSLLRSPKQALRIRAKHLAYALLGPETANKLASKLIGS